MKELAKWISTKGWTSTETTEIMELIENNKKGPASKEKIRADTAWLNKVVHRYRNISYVAFVKTKPGNVMKMVPRLTFRAYLVKRKAKGGHTPVEVWMLYLVPR